jgi:hypothetical protein
MFVEASRSGDSVEGGPQQNSKAEVARLTGVSLCSVKRIGQEGPVVHVDLRSRLEAARLDLLALFRALDRMDLTAREIPQLILRQLFELDADYAEALWIFLSCSNRSGHGH